MIYYPNQFKVKDECYGKKTGQPISTHNKSAADITLKAFRQKYGNSLWIKVYLIWLKYIKHIVVKGEMFIMSNFVLLFP